MVLKLQHRPFAGTLLEVHFNLVILTFSDTCLDVFREWMVKDRKELNSQCDVWEETAPRRKQATKLAKFLAQKHGKTRYLLGKTNKQIQKL